MKLNQLDGNDLERFSSNQSLHFTLQSGQLAVIMAGLVNVDLKAPGWCNENSAPSLFDTPLELTLALPRGLLEPGQRFQIEQAVPSLNLVAIEGATNVSWAINSFELSSAGALQDAVTITAQLAVSMTGEILKSVGYHITLLGRVLD